MVGEACKLRTQHFYLGTALTDQDPRPRGVNVEHHFVTGTVGRGIIDGCTNHCFYPSFVGKGDRTGIAVTEAD